MLLVVHWFGSDFDGDGFGDSLSLGGLSVHFLWTGDRVSDQGRPMGENWKAILREALLTNDFVLEFLNRTDAAEVARVRKAAIEIVGDATSDRQKVERLLGWLDRGWDFSVERSVVNASALLEKRHGMCETSGLVVGLLDSLGIKAREVATSGPGLGIDVEVWIEGKWRLARVFGNRQLENRSIIETLPGHEFDACIVYYWRDLKGKLFRTKLWYDPRIAAIFLTDHGLSEGAVPDVSRLRVSY
ncbi:MAG TPA: transglutaminase domain-containing protein [Vicinamibacteria bacterium]|nr:transglutaminase domain-containing protein [Vicinamibacteria bacterium]